MWIAPVAVVLVVMDQLIKIAAIRALAPDGVQTILEGLFSLAYVENRGAAFGVLQDARWFFIVVTAVLLLALTVFLVKKKPQSIWMKLAATLIYAGGVGNLIDRLQKGFVVDMFRFDFVDFPVFNFADICVVAGAIALCIYILFASDGENQVGGEEKPDQVGKNAPDDVEGADLVGEFVPNDNGETDRVGAEPQDEAKQSEQAEDATQNDREFENGEEGQDA
ncbi:MAG: signal peptidase II [Ruminococcaceae bacterium]|nr:signal peptidase II [Oscillospiraceae bacterium]